MTPPAKSPRCPARRSPRSSRPGTLLLPARSVKGDPGPKGVLDRLHQTAQEKPEDYQTFYEQFGAILREGIAIDIPNRERIAKLLRFGSTHAEGPLGTSLDEYL